jgi:cytoskeletal protein CcmA (bactofilin family)
MNTNQNPSQNLLSSDVELKGNLRFTGELTFDGKLEGEIATDGVLNLGDNAVITGNVSVGSIVVRGKINGTVTATDKIEIKAGTELFGDIRASKLIIEEGVTFVGKSEVNPNKAAPSSPFVGANSDGDLRTETLPQPAPITTLPTSAKPVRLGGR